MKKIELMHHLFGIKTGFCKDCEHFYRKQYGGTYRKCEAYGDSSIVYRMVKIEPEFSYRGKVRAYRTGKKRKKVKV